MKNRTCAVIPVKTSENVMLAYGAAGMNPIRFAWELRVPLHKLIGWLAIDAVQRFRPQRQQNIATN